MTNAIDDRPAAPPRPRRSIPQPPRSIVSRLHAYLRRRLQQPLVRPLALAGPILVLLISLPLLRPLRHPSDMSNEEAARLVTIQALVEHGTLAIDQTVGAYDGENLIRRQGQLYSDQPPMMSLLLSVPAWVMVRSGLSFETDTELIAYLLTVIGVTVPVAIACGLIYRMSRLFELRRPWRTGLAIAVVLGSGLISYAVVLNPHAPAATLVLASAACLIHVAAIERARRRAIWMMLAGGSAALAATLDPSAAILALMFMFVIAAMRLPLRARAVGAAMYLLGAAIPLAVHVHWNLPVTGDWLPASLHEHLVRGREPAEPAPVFDDEEPARSTIAAALEPLRWLTVAMVGSHGLLSHFPVLVFGVAGVFAVMHRHWPGSTKTLAAATLVGSVTIILMYCIWSADFRRAMFASRWFVVFAPMLMFWMGAWIRRAHAAGTWTLASLLLGFSMAVGLVGATGPYPAEGFRGYTALSAAKRLFTAPPADPSQDAVVGTAR